MKLAAALAMAAALSAAPDIYLVHDTPGPMRALAAILEKNGYRVAVEEQPAFRAHLGSLTAQAIFMYVHDEFEAPIEKRLIEWTRGGGRLIVLHHGMASAKMRNRDWPEFLGVRILPRDHPTHAWKVLRGNFQLVNLRPDHWVTSHRVNWPKTVAYTPSDSPSVEQILPAIELPDTELFHNQLFSDARRKTVLLGMKGEIDGRVIMQDRGGWMMPAGKGWVFYFQPGHFARDLQNESYSRIIMNAIEWQPPAERNPGHSEPRAPSNHGR
ncbi:MAG: ThuA domain-containing protein [Acidobacteria bacterium]|nr:ThuA domain-containing protein [Acidobacteriota bacterium]MBI3279216.1 ThuA domain-containing protein [Acidobacteriota bacterium]